MTLEEFIKTIKMTNFYFNMKIQNKDYGWISDEVFIWGDNYCEIHIGNGKVPSCKINSIVLYHDCFVLYRKLNIREKINYLITEEEYFMQETLSNLSDISLETIIDLQIISTDIFNAIKLFNETRK